MNARARRGAIVLHRGVRRGWWWCAADALPRRVEGRRCIRSA